MSETVATKGDSVPAKLQVFVKVPLRYGSVRRDTIVFGDCNLVALLAPHEQVDIFVLIGVLHTFLAVLGHFEGVRLESRPVGAVDGSGDRSALTVHKLVPQGVEFINRIVVLEGDQVATLITIGVSLVIEILIVEGLVHVTDVVDQKAECVGLSKLLITSVQTVQNVVVNVA